MEEVQREAKACKSCTPFTKLNIPNIWEKVNQKDKHYNITNKASRIYFNNKACTKEN